MNSKSLGILDRVGVRDLIDASENMVRLLTLVNINIGSMAGYEKRRELSEALSSFEGMQADVKKCLSVFRRISICQDEGCFDDSPAHTNLTKNQINRIRHLREYLDEVRQVEREDFDKWFAGKKTFCTNIGAGLILIEDDE